MVRMRMGMGMMQVRSQVVRMSWDGLRASARRGIGARRRVVVIRIVHGVVGSIVRIVHVRRVTIESRLSTWWRRRWCLRRGATRGRRRTIRRKGRLLGWLSRRWLRLGWLIGLSRLGWLILI
jgi:hypothetical protein